MSSLAVANSSASPGLDHWYSATKVVRWVAEAPLAEEAFEKQGSTAFERWCSIRRLHSAWVIAPLLEKRLPAAQARCLGACVSFRLPVVPQASWACTQAPKHMVATPLPLLPVQCSPGISSARQRSGSTSPAGGSKDESDASLGAPLLLGLARVGATARRGGVATTAAWCAAVLLLLLGTLSMAAWLLPRLPPLPGPLQRPAPTTTHSPTGGDAAAACSVTWLGFVDCSC